MWFRSENGSFACLLPKRKPPLAEPAGAGGQRAPILPRGPGGTRDTAQGPGVHPRCLASSRTSPSLHFGFSAAGSERQGTHGRDARPPSGLAEEKGSSGSAESRPKPQHRQAEQPGAMPGAGKEPSGGRNLRRKGPGTQHRQNKGPIYTRLTQAPSLGSNSYTGSRAEPRASFNYHYYYYNFVGSSKAAAFAQI